MIDCTCGAYFSDQHTIACLIKQRKTNLALSKIGTEEFRKQLLAAVKKYETNMSNPSTEYTTELLGRTPNSRIVLRTHKDGKLEMILDQRETDSLGDDRWITVNNFNTSSTDRSIRTIFDLLLNGWTLAKTGELAKLP